MYTSSSPVEEDEHIKSALRKLHCTTDYKHTQPTYEYQEDPRGTIFLSFFVLIGLLLTDIHDIHHTRRQIENRSRTLKKSDDRRGKRNTDVALNARTRTQRDSSCNDVQRRVTSELSFLLVLSSIQNTAYEDCSEGSVGASADIIDYASFAREMVKNRNLSMRTVAAEYVYKPVRVRKRDPDIVLCCRIDTTRMKLCARVARWNAATGRLFTISTSRRSWSKMMSGKVTIV